MGAMRWIRHLVALSNALLLLHLVVTCFMHLVVTCMSVQIPIRNTSHCTVLSGVQSSASVLTFRWKDRPKPRRSVGEGFRFTIAFACVDGIHRRQEVRGSGK